MFEGCKSLTYLNINNFNTSKVIDMNNMFGECFYLSSLNLFVVNTMNVNSMA